MIRVPCAQDLNLNAQSVVNGLRDYYIGWIKNLTRIKNIK